MVRSVFKAAFLAAGLAVAAAGVVSMQVVCCSAAAAQAAGSVQGQVVETNGAAVIGATVSLLRDGRVIRETRSTGSGAFALSNVPPGTYRLRIDLAGFQRFETEVLVTRDVTQVRVPMVTLARSTPEGVGAGRGFGGGAARPDGPATVTAEAPLPLAAPTAAGRVAEPPASQILSAGSYRQGSGNAATGYVEHYPSALPTAGRGEGYAHVTANRFRRTSEEPLSTFGADVDTASFANVRRFLRRGQLPPPDAVRVEELVNYVRFGYDRPRGDHPIRITTEVADAPWNPRHKLVLIGARADVLEAREITGRNIVLLVDVSGSMASDDKLPLLKSAFGLFIDTLEPADRVAIVTYAGSSGIALPPTPVRDRARILAAIQGLGAGGSTNGAGGIATAYRLARGSFLERGVNRVILATDGDFNVGVTSHEGLLALIEREKQSGVFLSVLGVGTGNLQDATMELLADKGNGNYSYLDSLQEAKRVLVHDVGSTLETVAKDVKFQVEFNPSEVSAWKLIGYENRRLAHEDFNDDEKDGGEVGAGHTVTVLYEIVPVGVTAEADGDGSSGRPLVDPLRYQSPLDERRPAAPASARRRHAGEWLTVKVRYQPPDGHTSRLLVHTVSTQPSTRPVHLPLAAAVAEFGLLLREPNTGTDRRWQALLERLEAMSVTPGLRAERDQVLELAVLARDLSRLR